MKTIPYLLLFPAIILSVSLFAQGPFWGAKKPLPFETPVSSLKPGQFTWEPKIAPTGPILVLVSLDEQIAYTYRNGLLIGVATVSTGKKGHLTPTGVFQTLQKDIDHHSSKYNNAAMPYTQRLTNFGIALHAGGIPGYPSSHGCIHLPSEYARLLFQAAPLGMTVVITTAKTASQQVDHPTFLAPIAQKGLTTDLEKLNENETYRWQPEKSASGPLSIVISRFDQRLVVMRNGIEIGRSKLSVRNPQDSIGTHVLIAKQVDTIESKKISTSAEQIRNWIQLSFVDQGYEPNTMEDPFQDDRIAIPHEFLAKLIPTIQTGTSIVLTDAPILENTTTGVGLTLMTSSPIAKNN